MPVKSAQGGADVAGVKTNEREGTRAVLRHSRMSASKVRQVLDLIRGQDADRAAEILSLGDREAAATVGKVLASAVANAVHNDGLDAEDLYVSACYADEGSTLKRWRPRARGRATRIRKRTSHITVIVSRLPDERIARRRAKQAAGGSQRSRRVAGSRRRQQSEATESSAPVTGAEDIAVETDPDIIDVDVVEAELVGTGSTEVEGEGTDDVGDSEADATSDATGGDDGTDGESAEEKGK
jgi:large subunit ribosomal protein L22